MSPTSFLTTVLVAVLAGALAGCIRPSDTVMGSATMPVDFGPTAGSLFGCAVVTGLYAWPPVQGEANDGVPRNVQGPRGPMLVPVGTPLYREAQLWIAKVGSVGTIDVRSRMVNRDPNLRIGSLTRGWSQAEVSGSKLDCDDGAWTYVAAPAQEGDARANYENILLRDYGAERVELGIRLQALENGDLALGQFTRLAFRADGRNGPPAAGESALDPPNTVIWSWSRVSRLGDTGDGVPPDDAALVAR